MTAGKVPVVALRFIGSLLCCFPEWLQNAGCKTAPGIPVVIPDFLNLTDLWIQDY
jgi:hypothetical protein